MELIGTIITYVIMICCVVGGVSYIIDDQSELGQSFSDGLGAMAKVEIETHRPVTFDGVVIRVRDDYALAMHIDLDEANACAFQTGESGHLIR